MGDNDRGRNQDRDSIHEGRSGLSLPSEDGGHRSGAGGRGRRGGGFQEALRRAGRLDEGMAARWFIPLAALVVVLFLVNLAMHYSQESELAAWKEEVASLREQVAAARDNDAGARLDRIQARVEALDTRLGAITKPNEQSQALGSSIERLGSRIDALASRVEKVEQPEADSGGAASASSDSAANGGEASQRPAQSEGGAWVINLITVSDRASAESVVARLGEMGVDAAIEPVTRDDKTLHRVLVPGFASRADAEAAAPGLKQALEISGDPWISRR